jgi:hypothetical protein
MLGRMAYCQSQKIAQDFRIVMLPLGRLGCDCSCSVRIAM